MKLKEITLTDSEIESELDNLRMNLSLPYPKSKAHIIWLENQINILENLLK